MYRTAFLTAGSLLLTAGSLLLLACLGCSQRQPALPYYNTPDFTPLFSADSANHTIGDFAFTNQDGRLITQKDIEGKIHVADFIFTSCGSICPVMTDNLKQVSEAFRNDTNLVLLSFSVTPWIDSVAKLKKFTETKHISNPNWHFLTGSQAAIYSLARRSYFAEEDLGFTKDSTEFLHTEHILLVDKHKRIRGIYNGTLRLETEQLAKDIATLRQE